MSRRRARGRWKPLSPEMRARALQTLLWLWPTEAAAQVAYDLAVEHAKAGKVLVFDNSVGKTEIDLRDGMVSISVSPYRGLPQ